MRINKGTKTVDLSDAKVIEALSKRGVSAQNVLWLDPPPAVAVKYNGEKKWWVLKGQAGVNFKTFDGSNLKPRYMFAIFDKLATDKSKRIFTQTVGTQVRKLAEKDLALLEHPLGIGAFSEPQLAQFMKKQIKR